MKKYYILAKYKKNVHIFIPFKSFHPWRTAGSLTVQDKQGTHEQLPLNNNNNNKNTAVDRSGNNTVLSIKWM